MNVEFGIIVRYSCVQGGKENEVTAFTRVIIDREIKTKIGSVVGLCILWWSL